MPGSKDESRESQETNTQPQTNEPHGVLQNIQYEVRNNREEEKRLSTRKDGVVAKRSGHQYCKPGGA